MFNKKVNCIDCGTEFCPCKLAESNECLVCSQLQGSCFCDCINWNGVCVYQELHNNNGKAKKERSTYYCDIISTENLQENLIKITIKVSHKLAIDLSKAGSYIFIKVDENKFFDIPISIMDSDTANNIITVMTEIRGIKTIKLKESLKSNKIVIRAPYFNGIFGLEDLNNQVEQNILILARGIGLAPMIPVVKNLSLNNNQIEVFSDISPFKENFSKDALSKYNITPRETNLLDKGNLSRECKFIIDSSINDKKISFIHIAGADILTYGVIEYLKKLRRDDILLSCCNNFKMCCGEGICGACTARFEGHTVRRFCKEQCDPRSIFEGRRFI